MNLFKVDFKYLDSGKLASTIAEIKTEMDLESLRDKICDDIKNYGYFLSDNKIIFKNDSLVTVIISQFS